MEDFIAQVAPYYHRYINLVKGTDAIAQLKTSLTENFSFLSKIPEDKSLFSYENGKWTIKQVIGHITDSERIFAYRALRIARNDQTNLPGFEQDDYVAAANFNEIKWMDLLHHYRSMRESNIALFSSFDEVALSREGMANNAPTNVKALIFITAGHEIHHMNVLKERYLKN
jgi:uncharacterized damage-inducible protein DinB